jgi:hypothetical protein
MALPPKPKYLEVTSERYRFVPELLARTCGNAPATLMKTPSLTHGVQVDRDKQICDLSSSSSE